MLQMALFAALATAVSRKRYYKKKFLKVEEDITNTMTPLHTVIIDNIRNKKKSNINLIRGAMFFTAYYQRDNI